MFRRRSLHRPPRTVDAPESSHPRCARQSQVGVAITSLGEPLVQGDPEHHGLPEHAYSLSLAGAALNTEGGVQGRSNNGIPVSGYPETASRNVAGQVQSTGKNSYDAAAPSTREDEFIITQTCSTVRLKHGNGCSSRRDRRDPWRWEKPSP